MANQPPMAAPLVYVASPLGFTEAGRRFNAEHLLPALEAAGLAFFDPWSEGPDAPDPKAIGRRNAAAIEGCDALLCVLEGQELDGGTCAEVGYACGLGKPVAGLRTDRRVTGEGLGTVNLQVEYFVLASGGRVCGSLDAAIDELTRLTGKSGRAGGG